MTAPRQTGSPASRPDMGTVSVGQLVSEVSQDMAMLMRQELALAKAEVKQEATKSGKAAGLLGGAGYMLLLFLSIAAWWGLANVMDQSWAAVIVAAVWAVIGAVLYAAGRARMREVNPTPERTAETLKELPGTLKDR